MRYNDAIRQLLADIAELNPKVGPVELICMWFDDLYRPGEICPKGYSREVWERGLREWKSCFTDGELRILARFHDKYASLVDALPTNWPGWEQAPGWQTVKKAAADALAELAKLSNSPG